MGEGLFAVTTLPAGAAVGRYEGEVLGACEMEARYGQAGAVWAAPVPGLGVVL
jgi:hypothetical protein